MESDMKTIENTSSRRKFIKRSALLGVGTISASVLPMASAEAFLFNKKEYKVVKTKLSMGTFVTMTAIHSSRDEAEEAIGLAFEEIDRLNGMLTRHGDRSPIATLNHEGRLEGAPPEAITLVERSQGYFRQTGGAFDMTVKPVIDLYQRSFASGSRPSEAEMQEVLQFVGSDQVQLSGNTLRLGKQGMAITLDGIAKGYIVDRASTILTKAGVNNHLINAGGDIRTSGSAALGKAWTVAVQDPDKGKNYPRVISMENGAIATSGNYEVYYDREKVFHHIVNGASGLSPQLSSSVTVVAPTVLDADALSTSVFVMGPKKGVNYINTLRQCECFIIGADKQIHTSANWPV